MNPVEKTAWFTLTVIVICLAAFAALFLAFRQELGSSRAMTVASSSFALAALTAFGPLIFRHRKHGDMVVVTQEGKTVRYPYRRYLTIGVLVGFVNGAVIFLIAWFKAGSASESLAAALPFIVIISVATLIVLIAIMYRMKQRTSVLTAENISTGDMFMFGPDLDELDLMIKRIARWSGFGAFWFVFVFGIMGYWGWSFWQGRQGITVDINLLPLLLFGAFFLILAIDALVTVILYRRGY